MLLINQTTASSGNSEKPKFYGRRQGRRIRKAKTTLLEAFLPQIKLLAVGGCNPETLFDFPVKQICLEIGFGNGEHLAGQALHHPENGYIGAEVFKNGVANLLSIITGIKEGENLPQKIELLPHYKNNIRVFDDDIRLLFSQLPDSCLDKVYVLFPDPWPKKRHQNRRMINTDNLRELARLLKKGGVLRVVTDHKVYKGWTLRQLAVDSNFRWTATCGNDWKHEPSDWIETKYQRKAIHEGRRPVFLDFERI